MRVFKLVAVGLGIISGCQPQQKAFKVEDAVTPTAQAPIPTFGQPNKPVSQPGLEAALSEPIPQSPAAEPVQPAAMPPAHQAFSVPSQPQVRHYQAAPPVVDPRQSLSQTAPLRSTRHEAHNPSLGAGEFTDYIQWLQATEQAREQLRSSSLGGLGSFASISPTQQHVDSLYVQLRSSAERRAAAFSAFERNAKATKPNVPDDCLALDTYYNEAMNADRKEMAWWLAATRNGSIRAMNLTDLMSGTDQHARMIAEARHRANIELQIVHRKRRLPLPFRINSEQKR